MSEVKERKEMDKAFTWDLSSLYTSDADWEKDFDEIGPKLDACAAFKGKLDCAENIRKFYDAQFALFRKLENILNYAMLRHSEDTRAAEAQRMYDRAFGTYARAMSALSFADPEILSLPEEELEAITADECLKEYRFILEKLLKRKAHTLSAAEEGVIAAFREALQTPERASSALMDADMLYEPAVDSEGNTHELTGSNFVLLETSSDRVLRKSAFENFYKTFKNHINTLAATYAGNAKADAAEAALRHYGSAREGRLAQDNIPVSVYDNLIDTVRANMDVMHRYARLRKRILHLDELHYYDVYTPLAEGVSRHYTYDEPQEMVLKAVAPLGENYCETVRGAFRDRWIDVYPNKGKSSGAYSSGTFDSNPYILTNFTGTLDSVSTIAHEMGHSLHSWHTNHTQPYQYADYSLFVAEVASTVNENLLIESLLKEEKDPKTRLSLLNQYLEGFKGTVYRQTMFAEFEKITHAMAEENKALDPDTLCGIYEQLIRDYFGDALVVDDEVKYEWARIPHFYSSFYVYVYATGYSAAVALSQKILNEGESAVKAYLEFLSMGSSRYPLDELKHAGVDLSQPAPIETALKKFDEVLKEAEAIADELGL